MTTYHIKSGTFVYPSPWPWPDNRPLALYKNGMMSTARGISLSPDDAVKFEDEQFESFKNLVERMIEKDLPLFDYIYFKLPKNQWGIEVIAVKKRDCIITHG